MGSNLGNAKHNLDLALAALRLNLDSQLIVSGYWRSEAVNMAVSADPFINAVLVAATSLKPHDLLDLLEKIEDDLGRNKKKSVSEFKKRIYDSRIIDLDIITYGDLQISDSKLIIPHPRAKERLFVLMPLAEIRENFRFPDQKDSLAELIAQTPEMQIIRLGD